MENIVSRRYQKQIKHWYDGRKQHSFIRHLRQPYNLLKSWALRKSSRCFYLRNSQTDQMNTAIHSNNSSLCAEEGNQICRDTIMSQRSEFCQLPCSSTFTVLLFSAALLSFHSFWLTRNQVVPKEITLFSQFLCCFFFPTQWCFFSCATIPFFLYKIPVA